MGCPFPTPGDLLDPGIELGSPAMLYCLSHQRSPLTRKIEMKLPLFADDKTVENPMDEEAWKAVAKSRTRLSNFTFTFHFHALEKEMATHSSVLACRIPGTGEPGGLPSLGSHRVRHD